MNNYYVILPNGKRIELTPEQIGEEELPWSNYKIGMYTKGLTMRKIWLATFQKTDEHDSYKHTFEFVAEKIYKNECPTSEILMVEMTNLGLGMQDIVTLQEGFMMDWDDESYGEE